jgi:hypothetical protein
MHEGLWACGLLKQRMLSLNHNIRSTIAPERERERESVCVCVGARACMRLSSSVQFCLDQTTKIEGALHLIGTKYLQGRDCCEVLTGLMGYEIYI